MARHVVEHVKWTSGPARCGCMSCPSGTYMAPSMALDFQHAVADCGDCEAGKVDHDRDATTPCEDCSPGSYQENEKRSQCDECSPGTYQPSYAVTTEEDCAQCPLGTADLDVDPTTQCQDCPPGTYQHEREQTACTACVTGTYQPDTRVPDPELCVPCEKGRNDQDENPVTACQRCVVGRYQNDIGTTECSICELGTQQLQLGADSFADCYPCLVGKADSDSNPGTACTTCALGQYQDEERSSTCITCPQGSYQLLAGADDVTSCLSCPLGTSDTDYDSATACVDCPDGYYAPEPPADPAVGRGRTGQCIKCPGSEDVPLY
eukprot:COSAG06_NODE_17091_length_961_cov_1.437355_1_plen_320_part_11